MLSQKEKNDSLAYLNRVERAVETFIFCDLQNYEFLNFLIENVPSVKAQAGSVGTFLTQTRKALLTSAGRQTAGRLTNVVGTERAKFMLQRQSDLDEGVKATHNSVTKTAQKQREKLDDAERRLTNHITEIRIKIAQDLKNDLDFIKAQLEQLYEILILVQREQVEFFEEAFVALDYLVELLEELVGTADRIEAIVGHNKRVLDHIKPRINAIRNFTRDFDRTYGRNIDKTKDLIVEITNFDNRAPLITDVRGAVPRLLGGQDTILADVGTAVSGIAAIATNQLDVQNPALVAIGTETTTILALLTGGKIDPDKPLPGLKNFKKIVKEAVNDWFEEHKEDIFDEIKVDLTENIVGESYLKFDSNSTFYPTLLYKFKSNDFDKTPRYSQMQIRLLKKPDEIDENLIQMLKQKAKALKGFFYISGPFRCNYVAPERIFKTTLFTKDKIEVTKVFQNLLPLGFNTFEKNQLSYTESTQRIPYSRATNTPKSNIKINPTVKLEIRTMQLKSIFLQVNGWNKMIKLL